jgi:hypothetical protein
MSEVNEAELSGRLAAVELGLERCEHAIFGNGRPGLAADVAAAQATIAGFGQALTEIRDEARAESQRQIAQAQKMGELVERVSGSLANLAKFEKVIGPIIDWKKGVIIRLSTMAVTLSAVFSAFVYVVEHRESIIKFLTGQ